MKAGNRKKREYRRKTKAEMRARNAVDKIIIIPNGLKDIRKYLVRAKKKRPDLELPAKIVTADSTWADPESRRDGVIEMIIPKQALRRSKNGHPGIVGIEDCYLEEILEMLAGALASTRFSEDTSQHVIWAATIYKAFKFKRSVLKNKVRGKIHGPAGAGKLLFARAAVTV